MQAPRVRLGELMVKSGLLTPEQLDEALFLQRQDGRRLGTLLVELGMVSETQVTQILSEQLGVPWVSLHHIDFSRQLLNLVPREIVERYCLVPIYVRRVRHVGDSLYVAMDDPANQVALREVARYSGLHVRAMIAPPSDIRAAIRAYYGIQDGEGTVSNIRPPQESGIEIANLRASEESEPGEATPPLIILPSEPAIDEPVPASSEPSSRISPRAPGMPQPRHGKGAKIISLTLLDGTRINLPAKTGDTSAPRDEAEERLTARDLIVALRAAARGADATQVLGESVRWESMFASLLELLLRKELIADWEFIEELKNS